MEIVKVKDWLKSKKGMIAVSENGGELHFFPLPPDLNDASDIYASKGYREFAQKHHAKEIVKDEYRPQYIRDKSGMIIGWGGKCVSPPSIIEYLKSIQ